MAAFCLAHMGYQNPVSDKMIRNRTGASCTQDGEGHIREGLQSSLQEQQGPTGSADMTSDSTQALPYSIDIHQQSLERYKKMVKRVQTPRSPNQLYVLPLTDNQQYGWLASRSPEPWMHVRRFPQNLSDMTRFAEHMFRKEGVFGPF